ncbi:N-acetyl-gamma-glutamyl-phosphate reductase [Candidatus Pelagibacter sp.]|nr:N-acetyl-gamma-glutamyl-phosphate reductase [Candidatus Pelagibacter sp.]
MPKLNALIAGSTGYIGVQLIKLLIKHPNINIKYLCGNTSKGKAISYFDKSLKNKKLPRIIKFNNNLLHATDLVFTALPNGEAQKISNNLLKKNILIDLSADFRLKSAKAYLKWYKNKHKSITNIKNSIYALPEISKKNLKKYKIISCPGCYPTSVLLPLIPLIKMNLIKFENIIVDSKSGYSGAGRSVHKKYVNKNLYESLSAYGVGFHRHNSEIQQELNYHSKKKVKFIFTPHLSPMFRGILSTIYLDIKKGVNINHVSSKLKNFYKNDAFVKILPTNSHISTNDVINTNYCHVSVCKSKYRNKLIILSAIDNLIKGGAGQAIQNLNYYFGFNEKKGLI